MYVQVDVKSTQRKAMRRHHTDTFLSLQKNHGENFNYKHLWQYSRGICYRRMPILIRKFECEFLMDNIILTLTFVLNNHGANLGRGE